MGINFDGQACEATHPDFVDGKCLTCGGSHPATDAQIQDALASYAAWDAERSELSEAEGRGDYPDPDDWHSSDDSGIDLLHGIAALLNQCRA